MVHVNHVHLACAPCEWYVQAGCRAAQPVVSLGKVSDIAMYSLVSLGKFGSHDFHFVFGPYCN